MKKLDVLLVGCGPKSSEILAEATRSAFSGSVVRTAANVDEALGQMPDPGSGLLVLDRPNPDGVAKVEGAVDAGGLPRWAVVLVGTNPVAHWVETLAPDELNGQVIAHVFRSA